MRLRIIQNQKIWSVIQELGKDSMWRIVSITCKENIKIIMFIKTFKTIQKKLAQNLENALKKSVFRIKNILILYPEILDQNRYKFGIVLSYKLTKRKRFTNEKFYETSKIDIASWFNKTEI